MGDSHFSAAPTSLYGIVLLMAAIAYWILQHQLLRVNGRNSLIARALGGKDFKGKISPVLYVIAIPCAFINQWVSGGIYILVALMWLIPDKRIESVINEL